MPLPPPASWPAAAASAEATGEDAFVRESEAEPPGAGGPLDRGARLAAARDPRTAVWSTTVTSNLPSGPRRSSRATVLPVSGWAIPDAPGGLGPAAVGTTSKYCETAEFPGGARYAGCRLASAGRGSINAIARAMVKAAAIDRMMRFTFAAAER
jgi:hypothetical protein